MSSNRFLEFDSTYRNRNQYPIPSDFVAEISQSGTHGKAQAKDPVSNTSPILYWNSSFDQTSSTNNAVAIIQVGAVSSSPPVGFLSDPNTCTITTASPNMLSPTSNFYVGAVLTIAASGNVAQYVGRIQNYTLLTTTTAQITVTTPIPATNIGVAITASITNPSGATNSDLVPKLFVPGSISGDNYYINYYVENINTGESKLITAFDGTTHLATLSADTLTNWGGPNLNFAIRKEIPVSPFGATIVAINSPASIGTVTAVPFISGTSIQLASTASANSEQYLGSFLRMIQPLPVVASNFVIIAPYAQERRIGKYIAGNGNITAISGVTFYLDPITSSEQDNYYTGGIISAGGNSAYVTNYNGTTHSGTTAVALGVGAPVAWSMRTAIIDQPFSVAPVPGATGNYEIEMFSRDNFVPFAYTGSLVSSEQEVCCDVELINLTLPNSLLKSAHGGRNIFYPYFYTELQAISTGGLRNILYSNNPNSSKALFRVVIDDNTATTVSPFIKVDSDGMAQRIKFKPNDSFRFVVKHSSGELVQTVSSDNYSPTEPNPLVQISACFSFRKVTD